MCLVVGVVGQRPRHKRKSISSPESNVRSPFHCRLCLLVVRDQRVSFGSLLFTLLQIKSSHREAVECYL